MNKLVRGLLSGASLVTLQLCAVSAARAAGTTITGAHGSVTNAAGNTVDFIQVTAATITGDLTNEGTVSPGSGSYGIDVTNSTISGAVINAATGVIDVTNGYYGIEIDSNGVVAGGVQNAGKILVSNSTTSGGYHSAKAVLYDSNSVAAISNSGSIGVNVQIVATGATQAHANAKGAYESVYAWNGTSNGAAATETFTNANTGSFNVTAAATLTDYYAKASASARSAVFQYARDADNITQTISNDASLTLSAVANAHGSTESAKAYAHVKTAVGQYAYNDNSEHGGSIDQVITNTGALIASAKAVATAAGSDYASARAYVTRLFEQKAYNADAITQSITNEGALTLKATASAIGQSSNVSISAYARVEDIFRQSAYNNSSTGASIDQAITNHGDISIALKALATRTVSYNDSDLTAEVWAENLFAQGAHSADAITQQITNTGAITITGNAKAVAGASNSYGTYADAGLEYVFEQSADATNSATLSIVNGGPISATMTAMATGPGAAANVYAEDFFYQDQDSSSATVSEAITNSGVVSVNMTASANGQDVDADAWLSELAYQDASGTSVTQSFANTNTGSLQFDLTAKAKGGTYASASASASDVFYQYAESSNVSQSFANSGTIAIGLHATATAATGSADAYARITDNPLIYQTVDNSGSNKIVQSITNSGALTLDMSAKAKGTASSGDGVHAEAKIDSAIYQYAYSAKNVSQSFVNANTGTIGIGLAATATGVGTATDVRAQAKMNTGVYQRAYGTGDNSPSKLTLSIANNGSFAVTAAAKANGGARATAKANLADEMFRQSGSAASTITESISNSGSIVLSQNALAKNGANDSYAYAGFNRLWEQYSDQGGYAGEVATLTALNKGSITASAYATATGPLYARAVASDSTVMSQTAKYAGSAVETITNSGSIAIHNVAKASGGTRDIAYAGVSMVASQEARHVTNATLSVVNSGTVSLHNTAQATGSQYASADAWGAFAEQYIDNGGPNGQGSMSVSNSSTINIVSNATAKAALNVDASAYATGVDDDLSYTPSTFAFDNSGTMNLSAVATGIPGTLGAGVTATSTRPSYVHAAAVGASVTARGSQGIWYNNASSKTVDFAAPLKVAISNSGTLNVSATAAGASLGFANISADAKGIAIFASSQTGHTQNNFGWVAAASSSVYSYSTQNRYGAGTASGAIDNSGTLSVSASAAGGKAEASGITVEAGTISADITNAKGGLIAVAASGATAHAVGIGEFAEIRSNYSFNQYNNQSGTRYTARHTNSSVHETGAATAVSGTIVNDGTISVSATAAGANIGDGGVMNIAFVSPTPSPSDIKARAEGIAVNAETMSASILNAGTIDVAAVGASAVANGIHVMATQQGTQRQHVEVYKYRGTTSGYQWTSVTTSAPIHTAVLGGSTFSGKVSNSGTISVSAKGTGSKATGVLIEDAQDNGAFVNTGDIVVVGSGSGASAVGVAIDASSLGSHASFQNNGGTISATLNGGWGSAIDVSGAPSTLALGLNGGSIYGNIVENAAGNAISIGSGNLLLDGLINPSKAKLGSLMVGANGTLTLANNASQGNAAAYVHSYVQNGTLAITGGADGSSGSIHAASATLSGAAIVNLNLSATYGTSTTYKVVFSDAALSGTWSNVSANAATTFFSAAGAYSTNEADITLSRATFDSIGGLTDNEKAVGAAIETIYDTGGLSGPLSKLLGALFNLTPQQYADALETLSGIPAGELSAVDQAAVQSFLDAINNHLGDTTGGDGGVAMLQSSPSQSLAANSAPSNVTPAQASSLSGTTVWGGGFQSGNSVDRTNSGPGYSSHQSGLLAGVDVPVARDLLVGIAGSYGTGDIKTDKQLAFGTFSAAQIAGYARFVSDMGVYAMGDVSYGSFTNKLSRYIAIPGFGAGNVHGKFNSTAWGLYGEAGWKFNPSDWAMSLTPYAALSYLDAKSDGYTETGFGVPLVIGGSSSKATSSYLGLKLSTDWDVGTATITPRLTAAWQHDFTKNAWEMSAAFAAVPTVGFGLNGSALSRDGAYLDGGVTLHIADQVNVLLDYQGRFTSDRTDQAFIARANVRF